METAATWRCAHGKLADDWCIRCQADDMIALRKEGKSYAAVARATGYSPTTVRSWVRIRERELRP